MTTEQEAKDLDRDEWWECPVCGGQTETDIEGDGPDRYCTECDWSVRIPRQDEVDTT